MLPESANIVLAGPPGSGKSTVGPLLADELGRPFVDSDALIAAEAGRPISEIFATDGESHFRELERATLARLAHQSGQVIAVGGGALLNPLSRTLLQATGTVVCLCAKPSTLFERLAQSESRPLLAGDSSEARLRLLLKARREHYQSFSGRIPTDDLAITSVVSRVREHLTPLELHLPPTRILLGNGVRFRLPDLLGRRRAVLVTDDVLSPLWGERLAEHLGLPRIDLPSGENYKTLQTVRLLYDAFLQHGLDRNSVVIALGGGVLGDMVGFAAATFMRGLPWINLPTTLLAMIDASLGGKTGVDLPQGKNLVGAFHPPEAVLADPELLETLPLVERISGMAEVLKHGLIADADLFHTARPDRLTRDLLHRAMQVKIDIVTRDPFEKGERALLNLGHTLGHGLESASQFRLRHGEAVAIGLVGEAYLAGQLGLAAPNLYEQVAARLRRVGLPTHYSGDIPVGLVRQHMQRDKKSQAGHLRFALPTEIGHAVYDVAAPNDMIAETLQFLRRD